MPRNVSELLSHTVTEKIYRNGVLERERPYDVYKSLRELRRPDSKSSPPVNGFRLPTAWSVTDEQSTAFIGDMTLQDPWDDDLKSRWVGGYTYGPSSLSDQLSLPGVNDRARAEVECLSKIKDQKVNLAVAMAESHKTIEMIADRLSKIGRAALDVKRGKLQRAVKTLGYNRKGPAPKTTGKGFSSDWLEIQYGWTPLLSDVYGGYEEMRKKNETFGQVIGATRTIKIDGPMSSTEPVNGTQCIAHYKGTRTRVTKVSLWYDVDSAGLRQASRVGLVNPLEVAWELVPFSFLLDWAFPIGNFLSALDATTGLSFKGGSCTRVITGTRQGTLIPARKGGSGSMQCSQSYKNMERTVYLTSPIPAPYYKNPISVGHGLNALALLRSIF